MNSAANQAAWQLAMPFLIIAIIIFAACGIVWLFFCHGIDKLKHPEEWTDEGKSGERIMYRTLVDEIGVPENQILRNVYIPTKGGKTSEIDLIVVSKKGLIVFECKNYAGNIYGDGNRKQWIQYLGKKKSFFYNPFLQNRTHVKNLKEFLGPAGDVPIVPVVATITRGNWKVKNLGPEDYFLGINSHLKDILAKMEPSEQIAKYYKTIMAKLTPLSRPDESVREEHIKRIEQNRNH